MKKSQLVKIIKEELIKEEIKTSWDKTEVRTLCIQAMNDMTESVAFFLGKKGKLLDQNKWLKEKGL